MPSGFRQRLLPLALGALLYAPMAVQAVPASAPALESQARDFLGHGQDYARHQQWQAAIALYKNALDINPALADAHFLLGVAYQQQDRAQASAAALRKAGQLNPRSARTFYNLGVAYANTGEMAKEIAAYRRALQLDPDHISAHYNLATAYWAQGKDKKASEELFQAGRLYVRAGYRSQAREMLHLIQRIAPRSPYRQRLAKALQGE